MMMLLSISTPLSVQCVFEQNFFRGETRMLYDTTGTNNKFYKYKYYGNVYLNIQLVLKGLLHGT